MGLCYLTAYPIIKMTCFLAIFVKKIEIQVHAQPHIHFTFCLPRAQESDSWNQSHLLPKWEIKRHANSRGDIEAYTPSAAKSHKVVKAMTKQEPGGNEGQRTPETEQSCVSSRVDPIMPAIEGVTQELWFHF